MFNWEKHKIIMVQILKDIYQNVKISSTLGFKGGTATYLFYGLNRYSADLDFDLLDIEDKDVVFNELEKIIGKYGALKEKYIKKNTIFFLLSYGEEERNIKVEVSTRNLKSKYNVLNYFGVSMLVMDKKDIFAHKLIALLERKKLASRDIFDIYFFFSQNWEINKELIEKRTGENFDRYLLKCINFIEKIDNNQILHGTGELLDKKQKEWARNNLKNDLIFIMKVWLQK